MISYETQHIVLYLHKLCMKELLEWVSIKIN